MVKETAKHGCGQDHHGMPPNECQHWVRKTDVQFMTNLCALLVLFRIITLVSNDVNVESIMKHANEESDVIFNDLFDVLLMMLDAC